MINKIKIVNQRFDELNDLIIQPDIISDQKNYIKLTKEYKEVKKIVDIGKKYQLLLDNISEAQEIISSESDDEMIEMAKLQLEDAKSQIPLIAVSYTHLTLPTILLV